MRQTAAGETSGGVIVNVTSIVDAWRKNVFTAADLQRKTFPQVKFVVPGILPEGLAILAGRPKVGKSWMALDFCLGVTTGIPVLGNITPATGAVLYCAMEDNQRRLQRRITKLIPTFTGKWPEKLTLATNWRKIDDGGVDDIRAWAAFTPDARLVILDTLAGVRPDRKKTESVYDSDYKALVDLQKLAGELGITIIVLTHTRKADSEDKFDAISGTLGLSGAADTLMILAAGAGGMTLNVKGREVEETEYAVSFSAASCRWTLLGCAADVHKSDTRKAVSSILLKATGPMGPQQIANLAQVPKNTIDQQLFKMLETGEVIKVNRGQYRHPDRSDLHPIPP
jgi:hypothetical protein